MKENIFNYFPLKIYRYLRWRKGVEASYRHNLQCFSKEYAEICLSIDTAEWKKRPLNERMLLCKKKDDYIIRYLETVCSDVISKYQNQTQIQTICSSEKKIWVFWWTGEETAPEIVKACIKSIRRNANGHEVIMLDQNNYRDYITLPETILKKHEQGIIGHAHFSDIIRLTLLAQYGGAWIDATVFISQPIPDFVFSNTFYTLKTIDPSATYYSKSRWCGYFLAGEQDFLLFSFVRDCLISFWLKSDQVIDYLLMDYLFGIAYARFEEVKSAIDDLPANNFKRGQLMKSINERYSEDLFRILATQETFASKLSWRYGNPVPLTKNGEMTNYGYLLGF